jgi:hypothetical protein
VKANSEMTMPEFNYTYALKRMMHDLALVKEDLRSAQTVGMQGLSHGALVRVEENLLILELSIRQALKTV